MKIKGKNILITGGSSGIGKATAIKLHNQGANILITGRDNLKLKKISSQHGIKSLEFDISKLESIEEKTKEILKKFDNKIDVLINNAGVGKSKKIDEIEIKDFLDVYNTNVFGLAILTSIIVKEFKKQRNGNIINIASTAALNGYEGGTIYGGSKFALRGMSKCWQKELRKFNVRVMLINPSEVTTAFGQKDRKERKDINNKLRSKEIADTISSILKIDDRGFIPELSVWATNPF